MRKLIVGSLSALLLILGAFTTGTQAAPRADEDGRRPNDHGRCTAYFNGQKNGHDKDGDGASKPGPFADLERQTEDEDQGEEDLEGEDSVASDVFEFCDQEGIGIGGNPEENGRFDCRETDEKTGTPRDQDEEEPDGEIECYVNGTEDDPDGPTGAPGPLPPQP